MTSRPMDAAPSGGGWQLEGDAAEAYEQYLVPALMDASARRLVERAALRPGERVLDVGCGTGIVARTAAPVVGPAGCVAGVDLNPGMLKVAARASATVVPGIVWREADTARLPFADHEWDAVLSQQMLQFVPDTRAALREMRRVLAPSGRLVLCVCRPIEFAAGYEPLATGLRRFAGAEAEAMMRSPFPDWSASHLRSLVAEGGFAGIAIHVEVLAVRYPSAMEFVRREAACSPLAGPIGAMSAQSRTALVEDLARALASRTDDEGIVLPLEVYLALARPS